MGIRDPWHLDRWKEQKNKLLSETVKTRYGMYGIWVGISFFCKHNLFFSKTTYGIYRQTLSSSVVLLIGEDLFFDVGPPKKKFYKLSWNATRRILTLLLQCTFLELRM